MEGNNQSINTALPDMAGWECAREKRKWKVGLHSLQCAQHLPECLFKDVSTVAVTVPPVSHAVTVCMHGFDCYTASTAQ